MTHVKMKSRYTHPVTTEVEIGSTVCRVDIQVPGIVTLYMHTTKKNSKHQGFLAAYAATLNDAVPRYMIIGAVVVFLSGL